MAPGVLAISYYQHPTSDLFWIVLNHDVCIFLVVADLAEGFDFHLFLWGFVMHWGASPGRYYFHKAMNLSKVFFFLAVLIRLVHGFV